MTTSLIDPEVFQRQVALRRDLHRHPELAWSENRTSDAIRRALDALGIPRRANVRGTGIVADIPGPETHSRVALRADIDALPIQEETGVDFASSREGVMHACGHDGHAAMLVGAAELLCRERSRPCPVRLIFQPAEEKGEGALAMIDAGALDGAAMIFGGHVDRHYRSGTIVVSEGAVNASSDAFRIEIFGQGAHGARPHESIDAVVVGSLLVMALQTIVSREIDPAHPSVVSVGLFQAGSAPNVIAGRAVLEGTVRAQDETVRSHLNASIKRIAESIGQLHGARIAVAFRRGTPALANSPEMAALAREAALRTVGAANVLPLKSANMGAEDFSYYLQKIPGAYVRFGGQIPGREGFPAHSSKFDFDEETLAVGAAYYYHLARLAGEKIARSS